MIQQGEQTADRTSFILGKSDISPLPDMIEIGKRLDEQNVGLIAIPCITANYFYKELSSKINARIIDTVGEICTYLTKRGFSRIGLMATSGTIESRLFQRACEQYGLELIIPSPQKQQDVMSVIYDDVKAGNPVRLNLFYGVANELRAAGAQVIVLGCTELSVVCESYDIGKGYLDAMRLMAKCAVEGCGKLRGEYRELVT